jgi:hypothetical protein
MKTTILTAAVLMALSLTARAGTESTDTVAPQDQSEMREANNRDRIEDKDFAKAKAEAEAKAKSEKADSKKGSIGSKVYTGFIDNNGVKGKLEVKTYDTDTLLKFTPEVCETGDCTKVVLYTSKNLDDLTAIRDTLGEKIKSETPLLTEAEKRRISKKEEATTAAITDKEVRDELADSLNLECNIDEEVVKSKRSIKKLEVTLDKTRFAGLDIPERSTDSNQSDQFRSDAECSASVLKAYMDEHEAEDLTDLKEKLNDLKGEERELKKLVSSAKSESDKTRFQKAVEFKQKEIASVQKEFDTAKKTAAAYDKAVSSVARKLVFDPAVSDLATRERFGSNASDFYLHDLAFTTGDSFKSVRKGATSSILDIYKRQAQSTLAFTEMANKTTDPIEKQRLLQAANFYRAAGMNYNTVMNSTVLKREFGHTAAQAGLEPGSILEEVYSMYNPGSQEITNYMTKAAGNKAGNLPEVLMVQNADGTYSKVVSGGNQSAAGVVRGQRVGAGARAGQLAMPVPSVPVGTPGSNLGRQMQPANSTIRSGRVGTL